MTDVGVDVSIGSEPAPGIGTSEFKAIAVAAAVHGLVLVAGYFHKSLDAQQAAAFIDGLAVVYALGRSFVKAAHALAAAVIVWVGNQQKQTSSSTATTVVNTAPAVPPAPAEVKP